MGCAVMGLIALSPKSEAGRTAFFGPFTVLHQIHRMAKGVIGTASWYGIERQGKPTASGELFDKDRLTAAHRKLPFGAKVRVTNLKNLQSTLLTINDRGPGIANRAIDVSWAGAKQLGFLDAGLARVEINVVSYPLSCLPHATALQTPKLN